MLAQGTLLPRIGNCLPFLLVFEVIPHELRTFVSIAVCHHLFARLKQFMEVFFPVGHEERAHACGIIETRIVRVRENIPMMVDCNLGPRENFKHLPAPCQALITVSNRRAGCEMVNARRPDLYLRDARTKSL